MLVWWRWRSNKERSSNQTKAGTYPWYLFVNHVVNITLLSSHYRLDSVLGQERHALNGQRIVSVVWNVCKDFSFWRIAEIFVPPTIDKCNNWTHRKQLTLFYLCKDFSFWRIAEKQSLPPAMDEGDNWTLQLPLLVEVSLTWSVQVILFWYCGRSKHVPTSCRGDEAKMKVK